VSTRLALENQHIAALQPAHTLRRDFGLRRNGGNYRIGASFFGRPLLEPHARLTHISMQEKATSCLKDLIFSHSGELVALTLGTQTSAPQALHSKRSRYEDAGAARRSISVSHMGTLQFGHCGRALSQWS
jgi:hypothetical protein